MTYLFVYLYMEKRVKRVAVIGTRTITKAQGVEEVIDYHQPTEIVGGGCRGASEIGRTYARNKGLAYMEFKPKYSKYGRIAPHIRNELIAKYCDVMIAIWDGKSKGTKSEIDKATRAGKEVIIFYCKDS
ncbi:hypothetical protein [uncultured Microscilla sp.]|uniref:hypothetical protein n=1 Tax=uncultured Microscilla sp. TaxID=432653 RepID=UPI00260322BD|nr:hypothetical protein [uncultured Microscilla sp.]